MQGFRDEKGGFGGPQRPHSTQGSYTLVLRPVMSFVGCLWGPYTWPGFSVSVFSKVWLMWFAFGNKPKS